MAHTVYDDIELVHKWVAQNNAQLRIDSSSTHTEMCLRREDIRNFICICTSINDGYRYTAAWLRNNEATAK
jgi:hypothetical protein